MSAQTFFFPSQEAGIFNVSDGRQVVVGVSELRDEILKTSTCLSISLCLPLVRLAACSTTSDYILGI